MVMGAILGAAIGAVVAVVYALFAKGNPCPRCGRPLPLPWLVPPRACPRCGHPLNKRVTNRPADEERVLPGGRKPAASAAGAWVLGLAILAALGGLGLAGYFLPGALESRRVWLYQEGRVEDQLSEMRALEQQAGPAAQARLRQAREQFRKDDWHPEIYHEEFVQRMLLAGTGVFFLAVGGALLLIRWLVFRARASGSAG
jgi:hypothetical protein